MKMKQTIKDSPAQKDINKFFGIQIRKINCDINKTKTNKQNDIRKNKSKS